MLPLRHAGLWRVLSALLLLGVLAGTLMPAVWFDGRFDVSHWLEHRDKWLHGLTFGFLALWFGGLYARPIYWRLAVGLTAFGLLVEGCQMFVGYRTADWLDVAADIAGIIGGLSVAAAGVGGWAIWLENRYSHATQKY